MGEREEKLASLGYPMERRVPENNIIDQVAILGQTIYASGMVPFDKDVLTSKGKVPSEVSVEDAAKAAALCAANVLRAVSAKLGGLDKVLRVVRITGYVNTDPTFADCHLVINGATTLVKQVFGDEAGRHARTALGMAQLPLGTSVEWDAKTIAVVENQKIAWQSTAGTIETHGAVTFEEIDGATKVTVGLEYQAPGGVLGEAVAKMFSDPEDQLEEDLNRFKTVAERGDFSSAHAGPPTIRDGSYTSTASSAQRPDVGGQVIGTGSGADGNSGTRAV